MVVVASVTGGVVVVVVVRADGATETVGRAGGSVAGAVPQATTVNSNGPAMAHRANLSIVDNPPHRSGCTGRPGLDPRIVSASGPVTNAS
jgi:hypothetical protein